MIDTLEVAALEEIMLYLQENGAPDSVQDKLDEVIEGLRWKTEPPTESELYMVSWVTKTQSNESPSFIGFCEYSAEEERWLSEHSLPQSKFWGGAKIIGWRECPETMTNPEKGKIIA